MKDKSLFRGGLCRLRTKLLFSMFIPAVLLGMVGGIGIYSLRKLEQVAGRILADNYRSIQEVRKMERSLRELNRVKNDRGRDDETSATAIYQFDEALRQCESNITEKGESLVVGKIRKKWKKLRSFHVGKEKIQTQNIRARRDLVASLYHDLEKLVSLNENAMVKYESNTRHVARLMLGVVSGTALAAMTALALFAIISADRISRPVTEVADRLHMALKKDKESLESEEMSGGSRTLDEIGRLRMELDALLKRLSSYENEQIKKLSHLQGRLAVVMNEVLEGLVLLDEDHRVMSMNRVARAVMGPGSVEGARLDELDLRDDVREVMNPLLSGEFQNERDLGELVYQVDDEERVYRPRVLTVTGGDGSVDGYLLLFWDVTEQRRFEESRRRFISMISHQLKTPMTSLSMSVNLLQEKLSGMKPDQAELLTIASENCNGLSSLISDLIEAARDVTPDLVVRKQRVDIVRLLRSALRPLIPQAEEKGIELVMPIEKQPVWAGVDPVKFPWVVTNIAGNALRYTERGGRIDVDIAQNGYLIEVIVRDNGTGISAENIDKIFQPYVSLATEPDHGTHGLGLAIAREIMEAHAGSIAAESEPGKGTGFFIKFPA